ncbi:MAG: hypothetical protein ACXVFK_06880, partial [Solirubrobacteraceae bacterium]
KGMGFTDWTAARCTGARCGGPRGPARTVHPVAAAPTGRARGSGDAGWLIVAAMAVAALGVAVLLRRARRRHRRPAAGHRAARR